MTLNRNTIIDIIGTAVCDDLNGASDERVESVLLPILSLLDDGGDGSLIANVFTQQVSKLSLRVRLMLMMGLPAASGVEAAWAACVGIAACLREVGWDAVGTFRDVLKQAKAEDQGTICSVMQTTMTASTDWSDDLILYVYRTSRGMDIFIERSAAKLVECWVSQKRRLPQGWKGACQVGAPCKDVAQVELLRSIEYLGKASASEMSPKSTAGGSL